MLDNYDAQSSLLGYLKENPAIESVLISNGIGTEEIKESFWQGDDFSYPNVRISCEVIPAQADCGPDDITLSILVSSEQKSSKQSMVIAGAIAKQLHNKSFLNNGVRYVNVVVTRLPHPIQEDGLWQSEIQASARISAS